jgi:hydrogenase maturation protease
MLLVIGYGNELRRDDGVGPRVAREVASWGVAGVVTTAVHQLTPELADAVGQAAAVLFVDATADGGTAGVFVQPVRPAAATQLGHVCGPQALLALAETLSGRRPQAWLLTVVGRDFGFGEGLSAEVNAGLDRLLWVLRSWLEAEATVPGK